MQSQLQLQKQSDNNIWSVGQLRLFFNKAAGLSAATLLKKRLWHRCFPVNFAKFIRTPFFIEHFWTTASEPGETSHMSEISAEQCISLCKNKLFTGQRIYPTQLRSHLTHTSTQARSQLSGMIFLHVNSFFRAVCAIYTGLFI